MRTTARPQQRYDHRLRELVYLTGDVTLATDLGVPHSTARGWLRRAAPAVVSLDVTPLTELERQHEIVQLRRRVQKLAALLQLALALLRASGFTLSHERLPAGRDKLRILRAVDRARGWIPLRALLRVLDLSSSRFHARRRQEGCALDDQSPCPRTSPQRLTPAEVQVIGEMVTSPYRHVPTGTLAVLAQRLGRVWASPSTWYQLVRKCGWRRPRLRVHPAKPKVGLRTTRADEMWHIDTSVIRLLDGSRAYLHAVIDNFSRRILAWRVADSFAPANSVTVLLEACRHTTSADTTPVVLADGGVENVNAEVDALITSGILHRMLAFTELKFSNSMIEAWWRSLKHQWLFLPRWTVSPRSAAWSRSTSTSTMPCSRIPPFGARRLTRCTLGRETRCRRTWQPAQPLHAKPAMGPTDRPHARRARPFTWPPDDRGLTAVHDADGGARPEMTAGRDGPSRSQRNGPDQTRWPGVALGANGENSRVKVRNVPGASSAGRAVSEWDPFAGS